MAEDDTARPVSGEIMTGLTSSPAGHPAGSRADVLDAEFEVLLSPASTAPPAAASAGAVPRLAGMVILQKPEQPARAAPRRGGPIFWIAGVGLAAAAFWVSGGHALVRGETSPSEMIPAAGLSISVVQSRVDASGPHPLLFVDGEAKNLGGAGQELPPLEIAVVGNDGRVTRYRLGTAGRDLAPGESFVFSSRLAVPKNGVKTVSVHFAR